MSKVEILRGLITEKMTVAVREILAVVEATVVGYENEVMLLKRELIQHQRQLHSVLQPEVSLYRIDIDATETSEILSGHSAHNSELRLEHKNTGHRDDDTSEKCITDNEVEALACKVSQEETLLRHEESDCTSEDLPSDSSVANTDHREESLRDDTINSIQNSMVKKRQRLPGYRLNDILNNSDGDICDIDKKNGDCEWKPDKNKIFSNVKKQHLIKLWIGLLKNRPEPDLSNNGISDEALIRKIMCPQSFSKLDFFNLVISTFPELGQNKPFVTYLADSTNRSVLNLANKITLNELYKAFKSHQQEQLEFFIQPKEQEDTLNTLTTTHDDKSIRSNLKEKLATETGSTGQLFDEQENTSSFKDNNYSQAEADHVDEEHSPTLKSRKTTTKQREIASFSGSCQVCGTSFVTPALLTKHAFGHLDHPECRCGVCGQQLESSEQLKEHLETHQKLHQCNTCGRYFLTFVAFQRHVATHDTEKPFKRLDFDGAQTTEMSSYSSPKPGLRNVKDAKNNNDASEKLDFHLNEHQDSCDTLINKSLLHDDPTTNDLEEKPSEKEGSTEHTEEHDKPLMDLTAQSTDTEDDNDCQSKSTENEGKSYSCKVCGSTFKSKKVLAKHALYHLDSPECKCGVCNQLFESSEELKSHLGTHQKLHQCEICERNFLTFVIFQNHIATCQFRKSAKKHKYQPYKCDIDKDKDRPYKCHICPRSFRFESQLHVHSSEHTGLKPYCCDLCGKSHKCYRSYSTHKLTHTGEKNFSCVTCGKQFFGRKPLQQHEKIHTVREKKYLCDICSRAFYAEHLLRYHRKKHDESFRITCPVCNKSLKGELKEHMRTHTGEKPFTCKLCGDKFRLRNHLRSHIKIHLGIKPFTCSVCGYKCARKEQLAMHMRTHTGDKPYKCTQCDKAFTQSHCLKTHMKNHH